VIARFNIGGTAKYLAELLPDLDSRGIRTLLAVGSVQAGEVEDSKLAGLNFVRITNLGRKLSLRNDVKSYLALRKVAKEFMPNVIHSHTFKAGLLCRLMYFKIPKVHTFHGHLLTDPEFSKNQQTLINVAEKILAKLTQKVIVTGQKVAVDLIEHGIGKPERYLSIPGKEIPLNLTSRADARRSLGIEDEFVVLWIARLAAVKNPKLLVQVADLLPNYTFVLAGDGPEMERVRKSAPPNLRILGFVKVEEILLAGDMFLSTSLNEGIPYSLLEASSAGLPIVAVKAGAVEEIITDGVDGYLVEPSSLEIARKIQQLEKNRVLLNGMSIRIKEKSRNINSQTNPTLSHIVVYDQVQRS
jgi:glycosyltransferase involved in cell wall biosynthesis